MNAAMQATTFSLKMDKNTKSAFGELCGSIGISMSAAINAFIRQAIRQQRMNFSVLDENGFSPAEAAELKRRAREVKFGRTTRHSLIEG